MLSLSPRALRTLENLDRFGDEHFSARQLRATGIDVRQLKELLETGAVLSDKSGWYRVCGTGDHEMTTLQKARFVVSTVPTAVVSHESAAEILGIPCLATRRMYRNRPRLTVTTPAGMHKGKSDYRTVSAEIPETQIVDVDGIPVTSPVRTAVDVARFSDLRGALAVLDSTARALIADSLDDKGQLRFAVRSTDRVADTKRQFAHVVDGMRRWPGVVLARRAIRLLDPASESPLESASRAVMIEAEIPAPEVGVPIRVDGLDFWLDFLWSRFALIGEADGALKYASGDPRVLLDEKRREDALRADGFRFVRWGWDEAVLHPELLARKLRPYF